MKTFLSWDALGVVIFTTILVYYFRGIKNGLFSKENGADSSSESKSEAGDSSEFTKVPKGGEIDQVKPYDHAKYYDSTEFTQQGIRDIGSGLDDAGRLDKKD